MGSDWIDYVIGVAISVILVALVLAFLVVGIALGYAFTGIPCSNAGKLLNAETNYSISNGCWVKVNDRFLPMSEVVPIEKDGKTVLVPKAPIRMEINK